MTSLGVQRRSHSIAACSQRSAWPPGQARAIIFLTDCCSTYTRRRGVEEPLILKRAVKSEMHPILRCLFFQHRGLVDITAAEDGTGSYCDDDGGIFSRSPVEDLRSLPSTVSSTR